MNKLSDENINRCRSCKRVMFCPYPHKCMCPELNNEG